jgi:hypothetical protein
MSDFYWLSEAQVERLRAYLLKSRSNLESMIGGS